MNGYPVTFRFSVHWAELDAYNHVNNARHFTWFESGRALYFRQIGLMRDSTEGIGPILKTNHAEYLEPVDFPAELIVGVRVSKIGNTSFTMEYALGKAEDPDHHLARGSSVFVVIRYPSYEKLSMPPEIRAAIEKLEGRSFSNP